MAVIIMGFELFPHKMNSTRASKHGDVLKYLRIAFLAILAAIFIVGIVYLKFGFRSLPFWAVLLPLVFELLAVIVEFVHNKHLDRAASVVFLIAWPLNTVMSALILEILISLGLPIFNPGVLIMFAPWLVLFVDFLLNQISFIRVQYVFPLVATIFFMFVWITDFDLLVFILSSTAVIIIKSVAIIGVLVVLELSRLIKVRSCKESDVEQALI
jgi:hypothetical protein